jgi:hypothetical protein
MLYLDSPEPVSMLTEVRHTALQNVSLAPGVRHLMAHWANRVIGWGR